MAYSIHIKGVRDEEDSKMIKLQLIFYKSGYNKVPKVITVTSLSKNWDQKSESFVDTFSSMPLPYPPVKLHVPFLVWMSDKYEQAFPLALKTVQVNKKKYVSVSASFFCIMKEPFSY
ncbi:hypothetical protein [Bacteroides sp.]